MPLLQTISAKDVRVVAGLMSGTSLDGVDTVIARIAGTGRDMQIDVLAFTTTPYEKGLRDLLYFNSHPEYSSVADLSQLNVRLAHVYAACVREALEQTGLDLTDLDLVGSHGQTVHHVPVPADCAGRPVTSSLQIGDPSVMANVLGVPVVGDFRVADVALGGQGAPLVPYLDYVCFAHPDETRALLNVGGIANVTILPAGCEDPSAVTAFDTGPGNMVVDALADRFFDERFDADGAQAARGTYDESVLAELLNDDFFTTPPPRSTGREHFGLAFAEHLVETCKAHRPEATAHDFLATATALTAFSVYQAYARYIRDEREIDVLIVSGGGVKNGQIMRYLANAFAPIPVKTVGDYGMDAEAKEALCFAVLAHETMNGVPTSLPSVTGASRPGLLGKICLPSP